jgi:hypothetical protein
VIISSTGSTFIGCVVSGGIIGLSNLNATGITISCTVFTGQAGDSITFTTGYGTISNCSFYAPSGNGINWTGIPSGVSLISNCYFEAVSGVGKAAIMNSQGTNTSLIVPISNAYYNCTANISGLQENFTVLDLGTLASAGFVSGSGGNFAPATVLQDIGFPGGFEAISAFKGYMTPGAVTPQNTGGGGTTYIFNVES